MGYRDESPRGKMEKVLIIRPGALGDTLMLLPALRALEKDVQVTVIGREPGISFLREAAAGCQDMERAGWHNLFRDVTDPAHGLPVPRQDLVVAFLRDRDGAVERNLNRSFPEARVLIKAAYPGEKENLHVADYLCHVLAEAGLPVDPSAAMKAAGSSALLSPGSVPSLPKRMVIHPGSGSPRKNLPRQFWTALVERLQHAPSMNGLHGVVLLGPAEAGLRSFFEDHVPGHGRVVFRPDKTTLKELLGHACLYVGHDSGITHLAAMLGTPAIAIFRESHMVLQWRPLGPAVQVVRCRGMDADCMERVMEAAKVLAPWGAGNHEP